VASLSALEARIQQASANHQPVMLDFYADWCISCKEMEAYTLTDPKVKQALTGFCGYCKRMSLKILMTIKPC